MTTTRVMFRPAHSRKRYHHFTIKGPNTAAVLLGFHNYYSDVTRIAEQRIRAADDDFAVVRFCGLNGKVKVALWGVSTMIENLGQQYVIITEQFNELENP